MTDKWLLDRMNATLGEVGLYARMDRVPKPPRRGWRTFRIWRLEDRAECGVIQCAVNGGFNTWFPPGYYHRTDGRADLYAHIGHGTALRAIVYGFQYAVQRRTKGWLRVNRWLYEEAKDALEGG